LPLEGGAQVGALCRDVAGGRGAGHRGAPINSRGLTRQMCDTPYQST
jgi:hypothetical protein